jgi:poly-gamma-glutamate synthesis protein (capsule biosynthesis protein)
MRSIKDARRQADLVIVAHHAAINEGKRGESPVPLVKTFARQCVDAGADVFVGHGWHSQLGIEIYEGKPIWYGTGNFFAQSPFLTRFPADTYDGHGFDMNELASLIPSDLHEKREVNMPHWAMHPGGVFATLDVKDGKFQGIKLYPFTLGYDFGSMGKTGSTRKVGNRLDGRPILTSGEDAKKIIEHVKTLSAQYGTNVEYKDGLGFIKIG